MQVGIEVIELEDDTTRTIDDEKRADNEVRNKYAYDGNDAINKALLQFPANHF
jgi:hypothetical protein